MEREQQILALAAAYAKQSKLSPASIGIYAVNNSRLIASLKNGAEVRRQTAARVIQWFSDHWPTDLDWPESIPRPAPAA